MSKVLMYGNTTIAEAAIRAGCQCYFGYPITPQNELTEYMAAHLSRRKGCSFVQAESEIAAINMVHAAAAAGVRVMTSSSSPGISLNMVMLGAFTRNSKVVSLPTLIKGLDESFKKKPKLIALNTKALTNGYELF